MRVSLAFAAALLLAGSCATHRSPGVDLARITAPPSSDSGFTLRQLAGGVYAVVRNEPLGLINESNSLFIIGDSDVIAVDAQSSSARTRETLAALRTVTNKPVSTLINTHWHDDHVIGNEVYKNAFPSLTIIAHATAPQDMATTGAEFRRGGVGNRTGTMSFLRNLVAKNESFLGGPIDREEARSHALSAALVEDYSNASATFMPLPATRTIDQSLELRQGNRRIQILFLGKGHTRGDLVVFLPDERILATGDLLMWPITFVGSTSYPADFAVTEERIRALEPAVIVPGHGKVLVAGEAREHLARTVRMLHAVVRQTEAAAARGETLEQARKSVDLSEARRELVGSSRLREVLFGYYVAGSGVARAYELAAKPTKKP